ncbi:unnamed protein product, partial [Amoebophrya sp. A25]
RRHAVLEFWCLLCCVGFAVGLFAYSFEISLQLVRSAEDAILASVDRAISTTRTSSSSR